jgi:hypothetical protein
MRHRLAATLVTIPIAGTGLLAAHALAYRLTTASAHDEHRLLDATGHAYLENGRMILVAAGAALLAAGLVLTARTGAARTARLPASLAAAPPLAFALQEHLERLTHDGTFPADLVTDRTFLLGLALQIPFALLAHAIARLLVRAADRLGVVLRSPVRLTPTSAPAALPPGSPDRRVTAPLARRAAGRAPPGRARVHRPASAA